MRYGIVPLANLTSRKYQRTSLSFETDCLMMSARSGKSKAEILFLFCQQDAELYAIAPGTLTMTGRPCGEQSYRYSASTTHAVSVDGIKTFFENTT